MAVMQGEYLTALKDELFILTANFSSAFKAGTVIRLVTNVGSRYQLRPSMYVRHADNKAYSGYEELPATKLSSITLEEVNLLMKPTEFIINEVGTTTYHKATTDAQKDAKIQAIVQARPTAKVAVYSLAGVAYVEPAPIQFTMAASLD